MFVQYRVKGTKHFARALHKLEAPCIVVMILRTNKTVLPSLKPLGDKELRNDKIQCSCCQTARHLTTRNQKGSCERTFFEL